MKLVTFSLPSTVDWKEIQMNLIVGAIATAIRATGWTVREEHINAKVMDELKNSGDNYIISSWHENIYFSTWLLRNRGLDPMISASKDGEIITRIMGKFGFTASRGSSSKGGGSALKEQIRKLKSGIPGAITPDGPKGPRREMKAGVIQLARLSGVPLVPWHYEARHQHVFEKSWDKHKLPRPFTRVVVSVGEPFYVPKDLPKDQIQACIEEFETRMAENVAKAEQKLAEF